MYRGIDRRNIDAKIDVRELNASARAYRANHRFLSSLRTAYTRGEITRHELLTLRGQALAGDIDGATKGFAKILRAAEGALGQ